MESAHLHPIPIPIPTPSRPPGPVAPAEAVRFVAHELPALDEAAAEALALIALAGRSRAEVDRGAGPDGAGTDGAGTDGDELAEALTRARKALRRKLHPLPGTGWCERAERLISDRIDGALEAPGPARLEAHLTNCSRCVEHDRRLAQAQDALVAGFMVAHPVRESGVESPQESPAVEVPARLPLLHVVRDPALPPLAPAPQAPLAPAPQALPAPPAAATPPAAPFAPGRLPAAVTAPPAPFIPARLPAAPVPPAAAPAFVPARLPAAPAPSAPPPPRPRTPAPWREAEPSPARPVLAARPAVEADSMWNTVGPLVVVLTLAVAIFVLAGVLATGA